MKKQTNKLRNYSIYHNKNIRIMLLISIFLFSMSTVLIKFEKDTIPINDYGNTENNIEINDNLQTDEAPITGNIPFSSQDVGDVPLPAIYDAAQFNISEQVVYTSKKQTLNINNENLTMDVPTNWEQNRYALDINSIYEENELFQNYSLNGNLYQKLAPWTFEYNPAYPIDYDHYPQYQNAQALYQLDDTSEVPLDYYGRFVNHISDFGRSSSNVELGELYQPEENYHAIDDEFQEDPGYLTIEDPYGGTKKKSYVGTNYYEIEEELETWISISSSWFERGNPSVAFLTDFFVPFEADQATVTFKWRVENRGYNFLDGFQVKARVDKQYIDGSIDSDGQPIFNDLGYPLGNPDSLEYDDQLGEANDHEYYEYEYNILDLLGGYGYRTGWHKLDFGCFMANPREGISGIGVGVFWDSVVIKIKHGDWYKAAELTFEDTLIDETGTGGNEDGGKSLAYCVYVGDGNNMMRYYINDTLAMEHGISETDLSERTIVFNQHYAPMFQVDYFKFAIGMERSIDKKYSTPLGALTIPQPMAERLVIDTFKLKVKYVLGTPADVGLQVKIAGVDIWYPINNIHNEGFFPDGIQTDPIEFQLNITDPSYQSFTNPEIRFNMGIEVIKFQEDMGSATVFVNDFADTKCTWVVQYDNTISVNEFDDISMLNNNFYQYAVTVENMPAHDGLGELSQDWNVSDVFLDYGVPYGDPDNYWYPGENLVTKSSNDPFLQNGTVLNATLGTSGSLYRGMWNLIAYQDNYITNGTFRHTDGSASVKFYDQDNANITLKTRNSTNILGNFQVQMVNSTYNKTDDFPIFYSNTNETIEIVKVNDTNSAGLHFFVSLWNDTDINNQTTRFGWSADLLQIWRRTEARILTSDGFEVPSGDIAGEYRVEYNYTIGSNSYGISRAQYVLGINYNTGRWWGTDWPPGDYLGDTLTDYNNGTYGVNLKTIGVPKANYNLSFFLYKPFYDQILTSNYRWLNITGILYEMNFTMLDGAFNDTTDVLKLDFDNIPYVNTSNTIIQFKLFNESSPTDISLRDAYITGSFVDKNDTFVAVEEYLFTNDPLDRGIYNLTIDTTGMDATDGTNKTLIIVFTRQGFKPFSVNLTISINKIPLSFDPDPIGDIYVEDSITINTALFKNLKDGEEPYSSADVYWSLYNSTNDFQFGNQLMNTISNVFQDTISLSGMYYLDEGSYYIILNASGMNLADSYSNQLNFSIFAKFETKIQITFPAEIRIGSSFSIAAKLSYINDTGIPQQNLLLRLNYSESYSYQVIVETNQLGRAIYELSIPSYYYTEDEINNFSVKADYGGNEVISPSTAFKKQEILGKIPVNISFVDLPSYVRTGYNATFNFNLSILGESNYEGKILFFFAFYNFYLGSTDQPFLIRELSTDDQGDASTTIDEIADGYDNITIFVEFLGDQAVSSKVVNISINILPKWTSELIINPPDKIQVGYNATFEVNLTIHGPSYTGQIVELFCYYDYDINLGESNVQFDSQELVINSNETISYTIKEIANGHDNLTVFYTYLGINQIFETSNIFTMEIYEKWITNLTLIDLPSNARKGQILKLNASLYSENETNDESFLGRSIKIIIKYGTITEEFNRITDENGNFYFEYTIPDMNLNTISITIRFSSTTKLQGVEKNYNINILDKKNTAIYISSFNSEQVFTGSYYVSVNLTDIEGIKLTGVNVTFLLFNKNDLIIPIDSVSGITNEEGFVSAFLNIENPGDYVIKAVFESQSIYAQSESNNIPIHAVTYLSLFVENLPMILLVTAIAAGSIFTFYRVVIIPKKMRKLEALKALLQRLEDAENIQYILVLTKTGMSLFSRSFTNVPIDENLVSGFLSAISSFGGEIGKGVAKKKTGEGLEQLSFQQFKIVVNDAALVRTALVCLENASDTLRNKLERFNLRFQEEYMGMLQNFKGKVPDESRVLEMVEEYLEVDLLYVHNLNMARVNEFMKTAEKKSIERILLEEAQKDVFGNSFRIRRMMNHLRGMGKEDIHVFNAIDSLRTDGAIFAINPRTQFLIDKFKPIIDRLPTDSKKILTEIMAGHNSENKLRKSKRIKNFDEGIVILKEMQLITSDYKLTETGEAVATILKLMKI